MIERLLAAKRAPAIDWNAVYAEELPRIYNYFRYWDELVLDPPGGAVYVDIRLLYQPTSWEYVQFLYLANDQQNAFLAKEGDYLLEAWLNTGQAEPYTMASIIWGSEPEPAWPRLRSAGRPEGSGRYGW